MLNQSRGFPVSTLTSRRHFLRLLALSSGGALLAACSQPAPPAPTAPAPKAEEPTKAAPAAPAAPAPAAGTGPRLVAATFAGVWVDGLQAGVVPCYRSKTGGDVELVVGTPTDFQQKVMATKDKPAFDVIIGTDAEVYQNAELGIIEKLDPAKIPNLQEILPIFRDPYEGWAFGFDGGRDGISYNSDKIKSVPSTWIEFTERVARGEFGRAVMYPHLTNTDGLIVSWLINRELGGTLEDFTPFIRRMKEMKPYIPKFYTSNADPGTALTRGEVDIAIWTDGRTHGVAASGSKNIMFKLPDPGSPMLSICMMKVKNGQDAAWEYLNCAANSRNQALWNQFFPGYYATHKDVEYPPDSRALQDPTSLDKSFKNWIIPPWKDLARVKPAWLEIWTREIGA
jgi:putative spermidine/putrescine transport system substrate-binding protein